MENSTSHLKPVKLGPNQSQLGYVMVRSAGYTQSRLSSEHKELAAKMERASKHGVAGLWTSLNFTDAEMKLMRKYNTDYCERLANSLQNSSDRFRDAGVSHALETYQLATQIQLQFSALR